MSVEQEADAKEAVHKALEERRQVGFERVEASHRQVEQEFYAQIVEYKTQKAQQEERLKVLREQTSQTVAWRSAAAHAAEARIKAQQAILNEKREKAIREKERYAFGESTMLLQCVFLTGIQ
eukprot:7438620-Pyramimonas_sp.AAC.1